LKAFNRGGWKVLKPDLYVITRFLDVLWRDDTGMKKSHLQMSVRLNYQTFLKYLDWLENHALIRIVQSEQGNETVILSEKGIEAHRRFVDWIKETMKELRI
jgi:predicted transcriptional regulator